jgi:hypothetical protein
MAFPADGLALSDDIRNKLIHAARDLDCDKADRAVTACRGVSQWLNAMA